jgi:hypothetical protein
MTSKRVMQFGGITLIAIALMLMVRTGSMALVLGAATGAGMPFWFQLSFMRLFATALAGLGVIFLWSASHLSSDQLRSLVWVVTFVLGGIGLMSATQQIAIWSSSSGWILAGLFASLALICGVSSAVVSPRRAS